MSRQPIVTSMSLTRDIEFGRVQFDGTATSARERCGRAPLVSEEMSVDGEPMPP